jgi:hypothetical protein
MFSRIHQKLGTAGFIIAIVALVAAMGGGAWAAQAKLTSPQKKEVKNLAQTEAKKFATAGPAGATGAPGAKGDAGAKGDTGTPGGPGADGNSVEAETVGKGAKCAEGGTVFKIATIEKGKACNGAEGSPWTVGGVLPTGKTETGTWVGAVKGAGSVAVVPISFFLPLETAPTPTFVEGTSAPGCPGIVSGKPTANSGNLCLYVGLKSGNVLEEEVSPGVFDKYILFTKPEPPGFNPGSSKAGTMFQFGCAASACTWFGTWAATA